jgi:hypothetical protein
VRNPAGLGHEPIVLSNPFLDLFISRQLVYHNVLCDPSLRAQVKWNYEELLSEACNRRLRGLLKPSESAQER